MLTDGRRSVDGHLGPRETHPAHARHLGEERVVAAGGLGAALDDVAGYHGSGQGVPVVTGPAVVPRRWAANDGRVGGSTGHHDVGTPVQGVDYAPAAEVGVGAHEAARVGQRLAGHHVGKVHAGGQQVVEAFQQVVAGHVGDGG